jgi:hypothetical protein
MAAPNIVNVTSIVGKTSAVNLDSTNATSILNNAASSDKLLKVNTIIVTNTDGLNAANISINYYDQDDLAGTAYPIASTISVPADSTLIVLDKNSALYIEENKSLGAVAGTADDLTVIISYEEIGDA